MSKLLEDYTIIDALFRNNSQLCNHTFLTILSDVTMNTTEV